MPGKRMINFMMGLLFVGIFCLSSGAFGSLCYDDAGLSSEEAVGNIQVPSEVVFIDPSVQEAEIIVSQLPEGAEVVRLSPIMEGVAQISAHLAGKMNLSAIRIISHGDAGHFALNGTRIDIDFLRDHGNVITSWGRSLVENGDILLYACNLAATDAGKVFINKFSHLTGADIAASTDVTGGEAFKGNWNLEYVTGRINAAVLALDPGVNIQLDTVTWVGSTSTAWGEEANWSPVSVPGGTDDVVIPEVLVDAYHDPTLIASTSIASIVINGGAVLNIGDENLIITTSGDFTNRGTISATSSYKIDIQAGGYIYLGNGTDPPTATIDSASGDVLLDSGEGYGIVLIGELEIVSDSGLVNFADKIDGLYSLTVDAGAGTAVFQGAIGGGTALSSLTITDSDGTNFDGDVKAGEVILTDTADNKNITFTGALVATTLTTTAAAEQAYNLDLHGSGTTIINAVTFTHTGTLALGNAAADTLLFDGGLTAILQSGVTLNGEVRTSGDTISIGDEGRAVTLAGTTSVLDTTNGGTAAGGAIIVGDTVDGTDDNTQSLTVNGGTGETAATFADHIGGTTPLATLTLTNGDLATGGNNITATGITVNGGTFNSASAAGIWDVGDVSIASGATMNATTGAVESSAFNVSGNWANSGTFNYKTGTVTLDGANQSISGSTTFYNLTKNTAVDATLTFPSSTTTIVKNALNLSGEGYLLSLRSSTSGTQWEIDPQGDRTIAYLDVKDSNNVNATAINAFGTNSVDSGNNTNWIFAAPTITSFSPTSGGTNTSVTITGTNFTGTTAVKFSGTDASDYDVNSETQITAEVGSGTTGKISVTTPGGTVQSSGDFTVRSITPNTYYVKIQSGNDSLDGLSSGNAWKTLHYAFDQINGGGAGSSGSSYTLNVLLGATYSTGNGEADRELTISQDYVTIVGESGSGPIIDGTEAGTWTKGLEITGANVTIQNLYITNFSYGIKIDGCSPEIRRNTIYDNEYNIGIDAGSPFIKNNLIYEATTGAVSYGITIGGSGTVSPKIYHNTIDGGLYDGISIADAGNSPEIKYNIITGFVTYTSSAGVENNSLGNPIIDYNDFYNNSNNYSGCSAGLNDISANPLYLGDGNYTLSVESPCINAIPTGTPPNDPVTIDLNGVSRPYGSGFDMGCYENDNLPAVTTTAVSSITTNSASSGGEEISAGGESSVTAKGVCWSTSANPTVALSTKTSDGTGTTAFTSNITGLNPNTTYHVRAYATNNNNMTGYGSDLTFTTSSISAPTVTTTAASSVTTNSASSGGDVTSDGGATLTERGVCWSTSANPTISNSHTSDGDIIGTFTSSITGLTSNITYHVRAYATNSNNMTGYGSDLTFTTTAATPGITSFDPTFGGTGTSVVITGSNFTGATSVKFGATAASSFTVDSETQITAVVGSGSTGKVTVTTPSDTATSSDDFTFVATGTYYVNISSGSDSNDGSAAHPWKTLHHAISQLNGGGTGTYVLYVALGTYSKSNGEQDAQLVLSQSSVTIKGESGSAPVIDGTNAQTWTKGLEITGSNVTMVNMYVTGFSDTNEEGIRISGGTGNEIRYCKVYANNWGIRVNEATSTTIKNCDIYNNTTHGVDIVQSTGTAVVYNKIHGTTGYGIRMESSPEINRNLIYDNTFGILIEALNENSASPTIKNNVIYETVPGAMSYGIFTRASNYSQTNPVMYHNTIDGGTLSGIAMEKDGNSSSAPIIKYNIITGFGQYGINNSGTSPTINYNDVWNNTADNYNGCTAGANDISLDPKYGSYSLQSDSPCINTIPSGEGDTVTLDYPGFKRPRPGKTTKDMGAYEYVADVTNNYTLPGGTGVSTDYRIFTVPLNLGTGVDMLKAMENVLGDYDPTHWRAFLYNGTSYNEFNSSQFASHTIKPGMGFWIITTYTDNIPFEAKPAPDGVDYVMELQPGWHLIGLPWTSTQITLSSIKVKDGVYTYTITSSDNNLTQRYMWDYTGDGLDNGYIKRSAVGFRLQNNKGYFFKVTATTSVRLIIPTSDAASDGTSTTIVQPLNQSISNEDYEAPPPPPGSEPIPDIKVNGQDGPVSINAGGSISVSVSLDPGAWSGRNADWWVAAHTPFDYPLDWYTYVYPADWRYGIHVCAQTPLFELLSTSPYNVLNTVLPAGDYIFYFAVDGNMDGETDATWLDYVEVNVE